MASLIPSFQQNDHISNKKKVYQECLSILCMVISMHQNGHFIGETLSIEMTILVVKVNEMAF
jgi:hypothetical protein